MNNEIAYCKIFPPIGIARLGLPFAGRRR